jgi:hypothetical protein
MRTATHASVGDRWREADITPQPCPPHTRPALLIARNARPWVRPAVVVQASTLALTQSGIGTVRTCALRPVAHRIGVYRAR